MLALIRQFHTHIMALEKEKKSQLYKKNQKENIDFKELQELENTMNYERKKEENQIKDMLQSISLNVEKFQREKKELRKHVHYLEKLKILMEDIEANIMQFK